jgi:cyclophilin family peptidyl-prolyl cis-trans isomerase
MKRIGFFALALVVVAVLVFAFISSGPSGPNPVVVMETSMGTINLELFQDKAPITVANFLKYVDARHYDATIFHRVISDFMIQGGGFEPGMNPKRAKFAPIRNEANNDLGNERGTIAMARTNDPNSATDQFFINVLDNTRKLGPNPKSAGYAVFGKVIEGMEVADKIRRVKTRTVGDYEDVPVEDVVIKSIRRADMK